MPRTRRPSGRDSRLFRRRHLVFTAHLPDDLRQAVAATEQDDPERAPVVWLPLATAAGLHLYPAIGPVLDQTTQPGTTIEPLLLPAMTGAAYQWR
ncbi:hypothetical protein KCMC57_up63740 [Kitasatospora sp. CMC57]|uniref:Uncharacterized protein n=1 Tax=Kitasatospora sp. CMC57 TaxID=3231513 RepID=A0AB33K330_9ACTN